MSWSHPEKLAFAEIEAAYLTLQKAVSRSADFTSDARTRWQADLARLGVALDIINKSRRPPEEWR